MLNSLKEKGRLILNILKPQRRLGLLSGLGLICAAFFALFIFGHSAYAEVTGDYGIADAIISTLAEGILWIASIFNSVTIFIIHFIVEIASYHNYINSSAVTLGWVLVRDVTNMLFVIILMVIAFGTVLGIEQYEWKKMLVKFVLAAILVNFSRIICGVIIDAAQVFMMTFISGVAAIAGGNLMNALGIDQINKLAADPDPTALSVTNVFASSIMIMIFSFAAMVIIGAYLVVLLGRLVALWVLIILSPLAFVLGVIPKFQSYASEWWQQFTNNVITGPVLAFFLWLAFAVAGGGNVHSNEFGADSVAYPLSDVQAEMDQAARDSDQGGSILLEILQMENLASFIIATALLLAGVKVTQRLSGVGAGVLGAAAGAATRFATVAGGVAAARWAVGAAAAGAKKVGRGALMKAPLVGGEAWQRRGRRIKARAQLAVGGVQKAREAATAKMYKAAKGVKMPVVGGLARAGAGLAGQVMMTSKQKEKRVKFLEGAAESLDKERDESLGMGGLKEGMLAGERLKSYQLAKEQADLEKEIGLTHPLEKLLREKGRNAEADAVASKRNQMQVDRAIKETGSLEKLREDIMTGKNAWGNKTGVQGLEELDKSMQIAQRQAVLDKDVALQKRIAEGEAKAKVYDNRNDYEKAELIRGAVAAETNKEMNEAYANLDSSDLLAMFNSKIEKRDDLNRQYQAAMTAGNTDLANKLEDKIVDAMRQINNFQTNTMDNDYVRKEAKKIGGQAAHYTGSDSLADAKKLHFSVLSGLDANETSNQATIERRYQKMMQSPGVQEEMKRRAAAAERLATKGDFREASIIDKGLVQDPRTRQFKVKRDYETNTGTHHMDGSPNLGPTGSIFEVDKGKIDFYKNEKLDFSNLFDGDVVFSGIDSSGKPTNLDIDQLEAIGNYLATKSTTNINSALPKKITEHWNKLASSGKISRTMADQMLDVLMKKITDERVKDRLRDGVLKGLA